jgi:hypothetical protein
LAAPPPTKEVKKFNGHVAGNTFFRYAQRQKIGKLNDLKVFGSNKTKGPTQDS